MFGTLQKLALNLRSRSRKRVIPAQDSTGSTWVKLWLILLWHGCRFVSLVLALAGSCLRVHLLDSPTKYDGAKVVQPSPTPWGNTLTFCLG